MTQIVAHRGDHSRYPENTIPAFESAVQVGADAVEFDVRLTADHVPVIFHYYYLEQITDLVGPLFRFRYEELDNVHFMSNNSAHNQGVRIPTLVEVLDTLSGRIGMEIEIKGPEPEVAQIIGSILSKYKSYWDALEITSYEPALLTAIRESCPGIATDLLIPRSECWMGLDVVAYQATHRARLAGARAVHLHPTQLEPDILSYIRDHGIDVHAWDVNDHAGLKSVAESGIKRFTTDELTSALKYQAGRLEK